MTLEEKQTITDLKKCNFTKMHAYFTRLTEERKNRTKEEKLVRASHYLAFCRRCPMVL